MDRCLAKFVLAIARDDRERGIERFMARVYRLCVFLAYAQTAKMVQSR